MTARVPTAALLVLAMAPISASGTLAAQQPPAGTRQAASTGEPPPGAEWNDHRALTLVRRAQQTRRSTAVDSTLASYRAEARGHVYFYMERPDVEERLLVKADQVALNLYWKAPDRARQEMVGHRDARLLPTSIRYHLDHLTVVQDDYGDLIRLGDGDEVQAVVHPVGPAAGAVYDYLLADSLTVRYGTEGGEVRVYRLQVRPKRLDRPGVIGSVYLDRATAQIVRMNLSFTASSYVDDYLDYIRISLDNSLWMGRHWLPYRQETEIRREIPLLDLSSGSIIRTRFEVGDYDFGVEIPDDVFERRSVLAVSPAQSRLFPFERGLFDEVDETALRESPRLDEVREEVRAAVEDQVLSGLARTRFSLDGFSDLARYNRAEGLYVGGGLTLSPWRDTRVRPSVGYAFGRGGVSARVVARGEKPTPVFEAYFDHLGDVGGHAGATLLTNTITSASDSEDFLDPYFRRGASLTLGSAAPWTVGFALERHRSAVDVVSEGPDTLFRPVLPIHDGTHAALSVGLTRRLRGEGRGQLTLTGATTAGRRSLGAEGLLDVRAGRPSEGRTGRLLVEAGAVGAGAPAQSMFMIGGRHTLPGHTYRSFVGNVYWLGRVEGTAPIHPPWVALRAFAVAGAAYASAGLELPAGWDASGSGGVRGSVGLGLALGWDAVHLDVAHGVRGGGWEAVVAVTERFRGWM